MVDPQLVAIGLGLAIVGGVAIYAYTSGRGASVNLDDDPEPEVTFVGADEADEAEEPMVAEVPEHLHDLDLTDIKGVGETRADDLEKAGFHTAADIYFASDDELRSVYGIGGRAVEQMRETVGRP